MGKRVSVPGNLETGVTQCGTYPHSLPFANIEMKKDQMYIELKIFDAIYRKWFWLFAEFVCIFLEAFSGSFSIKNTFVFCCLFPTQAGM